MRIHILCCLWGRQAITEIFKLGIDRLKTDFNISVTTVASSDSDFIHAQSLGLNPVFFENLPLGRKHNYGLKCALNDDWDALLIMGSDDLLSNEGLDLLVRSGKDYVGFRSMYAYETRFDESYLFEYAEGDFLIGAGRLISRASIERVWERTLIRYKPYRGLRGKSGSLVSEFFLNSVSARQLHDLGFCSLGGSVEGLWQDDLNRGLDGSSDRNLLLSGCSRSVLESEKVHVLDLKSSENINEVGMLYINGADKVVKLEGEGWSWFLSEQEKRAIKALRM